MLLLWCATPDSVIRLPATSLKEEVDVIANTYFLKQQHECLTDYLSHRLNSSDSQNIFAQVYDFTAIYIYMYIYIYVCVCVCL